MEFEDHAYTSTTYDKVSPVDFTYKMGANEVEEFVKLRVSNKYLFSGRRNTSMWAWRAILKHMGLQHNMTHMQASKKWENMKKRYKELKNPPDGVKVFPEVWPYFKLMDDAMEGRLEGSAPILKAIPSSGDFLPISRPKKRKVSVLINSPVLSPAGGPEIEVSLNGDDDEEAEEEGSQQIVRAMQEMDSEREMMERERQVLQRERAVLDREVAALDRDRASLERERATIEREKAVMERERAVVEKDRDAVNRDRLALEQERARLERIFATKERTKEVSEDCSKVNDSQVMDRKERFLNLFEKLIENF